MKALILAAGKGTRLGSLTQKYPKPMLPVGGQPLLEHLVNWLCAHGIGEIGINLHHAAETITQHLGDGSQYGVTIEYSYEPTLLGTAGAAKKLEWFLDETFVVVYGDIYTNVNLQRLAAFHREKMLQTEASAALSLSLYRVPNPTECGLVDLDSKGRIHRFVEKPPADQVFTDLANAGILIAEPAVLDQIPANQFYDFGHDVFPAMLADNQPIFGLPLADGEFLIDIGTPAAYQRAEEQHSRIFALQETS